MKKSLIVSLGIMAAFSAAAVQAGKHTVFASILPQGYFVERIGGERVDVEVLVPPGSSPATYEPTPRQMAALSDAQIFFRIGVPFENAFVPKIEEVTQGVRIVDTRKGIELREMKAHHHHDEEHEGEHQQQELHEVAGQEEEHEDEHHHEGGTDPHIWLNPKLVKVQARTIADALIEADPAGKATYESNFAVFSQELSELDAALSEALAPVKGKTFMVFHPAWGYFADAYGLEQEPIEMEGKDPSGQQLARMIDMAKEEGIRVIFVQPQFSTKSATHVAEAINGVVVPIDPLAPDYVANLQQVATLIGDTLQAQ